MTEPKTHWIADAEGTKALVTGAAELNLWTAGRGWVEADEPSGQEFVWLQHNLHEGRAKFSAEAVPLWEGRGWLPSTPPEPVNSATAHLADAEPVADKTEKTPKKAAASAVSGAEKE